jgi:hypothetical protein
VASDRAKRMLERFRAAGETETVQFVPEGGPRRPIEALVNREPPVDVGSSQGPALELMALNDAVAGLPPPASLDLRADRIEVAERFGGPVRSRSLVRIAAADADWVTVELR